MFKTKYIKVLIGIVTLLSCCVLIAEGTSLGTSKTATNKPKQISDEEVLRVSEAFGHFIGRNLNSPGVKFDLEKMIKGMRDGASGKPAPMSDEEYEASMTALQEKAFNAMADENLKSANEFLVKNAHEQGVIEIEPNKLQYIILEKGKEPEVREHGTPLINYTGKYIDGTIFGSSAEAGGPITLPLDQTIQGFSKGVVGMKEGEKRRLFVHPDLGYGKSGHLPPNVLLIFDIEVVKANSPDKDSANEEAMFLSESGETGSRESDDNDNDDDDDRERDEDNFDKDDLL